MRHHLAVTVHCCFKAISWLFILQQSTTGSSKPIYLPDKQVGQARNHWACIRTPDMAEHHHLRNQVILPDFHADTYSKNILFVYSKRLPIFEENRKQRELNPQLLVPALLHIARFLQWCHLKQEKKYSHAV